MAYDAGFGEWMHEHLAGLGPFEIRRMFGAAGVIAGGAMFAILDDGVIWLKADAALAAELEAQGARPFTYETRDGRAMTMAYWSLPDSAVDDPDEATAWARRSLDLALKKASARPARRKA